MWCSFSFPEVLSVLDAHKALKTEISVIEPFAFA